MKKERIRSLGLILETPNSENELGICESFESLGVRVVSICLDDEKWPGDLDAYLISGPFYPLSKALGKLVQVCQPRNPNVIIWLTEQQPSPRLPKWLINTIGDALRAACLALESLKQNPRAALLAGRLDWLYFGTRFRLVSEIRWLQDTGCLKLLAVLTPSHQKFFEEKIGIPAVVVPYGHYKTFGHAMSLERDIDVVFLGSLRDRRRASIVRWLRARFKAMGIRFVVYDGTPGNGLVFGEERTRLLNRTRIHLSIMRQPWDDAVFRMLLATPNGAMVVSEPVVDDTPFLPGNHLAVSEINRIPETVAYYLAHEDERQQIVQNAQDLLYNHMTSRLMAEKILQSL